MNRRIKISAIIGVVLFLATVLIFALSQPQIFTSTILGFVFLLYSEIMFFGGFALVEYLSSKTSGIITRAGLGITIGAYALVVFASSIIYMNLHINSARGFLVLQVLLVACAAIISIILVAVSKNKYTSDSKALKADTMVRGFADELVLIRDMSDKKESIDKLVEAMKYTDTSTMVDADVEIDEAIGELKNIVSAEGSDESKLNKSIEKIEFLIKKRNLQTRNEKQGGI